MLPRHRHWDAYIALVSSGSYDEAGDAGRFRVAAGEVLLHGAFEAHLNRYGTCGAEVMCFKLSQQAVPAPMRMRAADPDAVLRLAERDIIAATALLLDSLDPIPEPEADWPEALAAAIRSDPALRIGAWARARGLAAASVSRGFKQVFGVGPHAFRAQAKGRLAWRQLLVGDDPLAAVATNGGFSDQAHMTRTVRAVTGHTPGAWRKARQMDSKQRAG